MLRSENPAFTNLVLCGAGTVSADLPAWRIICLPGDRKSALSIVTYPVPVHLPMMTCVPVILMAATMYFGPLLELLLFSWTLMLKMPSVGAIASQMHWTMVLTCGYHEFVMFRLGQYPVVTTS